MSKVIFYMAIMWFNPYTKSKRGWPRVLYWQKMDSVGYEATQSFLENFYRECGVNEVPLKYCVAVMSKNVVPYKAQSPERILKQRLKKLDKKMNEQFPLFAEQFKRDELKKNPKKFDLEVIRGEQEERKKLADSIDPETKLTRGMAGSDSWKKYDWKRIRERLRRLMFSKPKKISEELMEGAMAKERRRWR